MERFLATANLAQAINSVQRFVSVDRRDDFEAATAQLVGCVYGMSTEDARAMAVKVRTEIDAAESAKKAGQS
jgi:hypothetical protein